MGQLRAGRFPASDVPPSKLWPQSFLLHVALLLLLGIGAAVVLGAVVWWSLGQPDLTSPPTVPTSTPTVPTSTPTPGGQPAGTPSPRPLTVTERLDSLKVILAVVGGIGAVVALTVAYRRQRHGEIATYREGLAEQRETIKAFSDRYGKAADQLGGDTAAVRVAGVYALAALADDWDDGRQMCIDLLCAYLRMPYERNAGSPGYLAGNREVRRTLLRVIRNHLRPGWTPVSWSGNKFSFEGATFDCGDLSGMRLDGDPEAGHDRRPNMTFHGARFVTGSFQFDDVDFGGTPVWFTKAEFAGATVTFRGARFQRGAVTFERARFTGGEVRFDGARFSGGEVSFDGAVHSGGDVSFRDAEHTGGTVSWGPFPPLPGPGAAPPP